jgi:hypothetical protein
LSAITLLPACSPLSPWDDAASRAIATSMLNLLRSNPNSSTSRPRAAGADDASAARRIPAL